MAFRRKRSTQKSSEGFKRSKTLDLGAFEDDIDSESDEEDYKKQEPSLESSDGSSDEEDPEEKRVRLARKYLDDIDQQADDSSSSEEEEEEDDRIARKLQKARLQREGTYERVLSRKIAENIHSTTNWAESIKLMKGHDLTPTSVSLTNDGRVAVSGSKDHSILTWDIEREQKVTTLACHWKKNKNEVDRTLGQVLSVACSDDGRYVAAGARDATVRLFDLRTSSLVKTFTGHKGPVTSLCFRKHTYQLFSASEDRTLRHYQLDELMYLESLFGHQFGVTSVDCFHTERPVSVGKDRTARLWKIAEDSHLIFRGGSRLAAADAVSIIKDNWFVTGHQDGAVGLWFGEKKKAVALHELAHGADERSLGRGIVSVDCLQSSDFCATGSCDGYLRFWNVQTGSRMDERGLAPVAQIPLAGYINDIALGPRGKFCVLAVGQEHKMGRWNRIPKAKNRIAVVRLHGDDMIDDREAEEIDEPPAVEASSDSDSYSSRDSSS